jgi:enolase
MPAICRILAREILDSRGHPTVEAEVHCDDGSWGRASVPSGASTGRHEAVELRDRDADRFGGKGVRQAIRHIHDVILPVLCGLEVSGQAVIDRRLCELDGTPDKSRLGANAILAVSLACAHAAAASRRVPLYSYLDPAGRAILPMPMVNMMSGGRHAGGQLAFQDFLLLPTGAKTYADALEMSVGVYRRLGEILARHGYEFALVGDEGGYGPRLPSNQHAVEILIEAIQAAGHNPGRDAAIAIDVASSQFYRDGRYELEGRQLTSTGMVEMLARWVERYPILSIEDGLAEDDWVGWRELTAALGNRIQLIGDDLFATHPARLQRGIREGIANSILVKMNQIGTLTETLAVAEQARQAGYAAILSARSGETEDPTLADVAVASGVGQIKIGCIVRGERLAKYNQLLRIAETLGPNQVYTGVKSLAPTEAWKAGSLARQ